MLVQSALRQPELRVDDPQVPVLCARKRATAAFKSPRQQTPRGFRMSHAHLPDRTCFATPVLTQPTGGALPEALAATSPSSINRLAPAAGIAMSGALVEPSHQCRHRFGWRQVRLRNRSPGDCFGVGEFSKPSKQHRRWRRIFSL